MEENKIHWGAKVFLVIALIAFISTWGDFLYRRYYPFTPAIVYGDLKVINKDKTVCAGDKLLYEIDIERRMLVPVKVRRALANGYLITFDDAAPPDKPLGRQLVRAQLHIPRNTECGKWYLKWTAYYTVVEGRVVAVNAKSEPFEVVKCP